MSSERRYTIIENVIYLVLWILVFTVPVFSVSARTEGQDSAFNWEEVFLTWSAILPYLLLFLVHNFFVSRLFFRKKRWLYFLIVAVLLAVHPGISIATKGRVSFQLIHPMPADAEMPEVEFWTDDPPFEEEMDPYWYDTGPEPWEETGRMEPIDIMALAKFALAVMMLALNLIIKWSFKARVIEEKVSLMQEEMLRGQLQQLRHQINPHFFMNTLNNIHALVDIDPEKAKNTIIELSKLMRYVLYDSKDGLISLENEKSFLEKYLSIMSIRYSDKVRITAGFDVDGKEGHLPSMLLVTFIENAFKHGITYRKESVLDTSLRMEGGRILFSCYNTKNDTANDQHGGVGLKNVRRRLDIFYKDDYVLDVDEDEVSYRVTLSLPSEPALKMARKN